MCNCVWENYTNEYRVALRDSVTIGGSKFIFIAPNSVGAPALVKANINSKLAMLYVNLEMDLVFAL